MKQLIMIGFTIGEEQTATQNKNTKKSILELYPQYDFVLADAQFSKISKIIIAYAVIPVFWGEFIIMLITNTIGRFNKLRSLNPRIIYIQNPNEKWWKGRAHLFIVDENRKWGLVRTNTLKLLIEPQYDSMKWVKRDKLIEVMIGDDRLLIDINNNICI